VSEAAAPTRGHEGLTGPVGVAVQTVRYGHDPRWLAERWAPALAQALEVARDEGRLREAAVRVGDCSPEPLSLVAQDALAAVFEPLGVRCWYRAFGVNLGHGRGQNALAEEGRAQVAAEGRTQPEVLVLLNPDALAHPRLLVELLAGLGEPGVGLVEGRQSPIELPKALDPATGETPWVSACCLAVRRDAFEALGGFHPAYFLQGDDVDLSWRARLAGWALRSRPAALCFHDKRLRADGHLAVGATEEQGTAAGALLLCWRFGLAEGLAHLREALRRGSPAQRAALEAFEAAEAAGQLPEPVPGAEAVARFDGGTWGPLRFPLATGQPGVAARAGEEEQ
jgi:GT2 family glycosyltransferase